MILATVTFGTLPRRGQKREQLEDVAENYLCALFRSGQLCGENFLTWIRGQLTAHVILTTPAASARRYHSPRGRRELRQVTKTFGHAPKWRLLDDIRPRPSSWRGAPFLYLFTHAFDWASPVCRGDGQPPIPLCTLPVADEIKEQVYTWQQSYVLHDRMWIESGALEIGAYRQLVDPASELSEEGRSICREIEKATGVATYYYQARYWARRKDEERRRCPGCGGAWTTGLEPTTPKKFWQFEFRCNPCRLVAHPGVSTDGGRHTRIGEFKPRNKTVPPRAIRA